jgi:hypothetical protein
MPDASILVAIMWKNQQKDSEKECALFTTRENSWRITGSICRKYWIFENENAAEY